MNPKWSGILEAVLLIVIAAAVFLPHVGGLTYFKDDWYYVYDGVAAGAEVFHAMFSIDRPARGFFFELYYSLFGPLPLPYHLGAFAWRALAALGALWLFRGLWPDERQFTFLTALAFAVYPGYSWWVSAIEYQPMIASLALQVLSTALTVAAVRAGGRVPRAAYLIGAILTGWACLALVDYAIGMEAFRFLCVGILIRREGHPGSRWRVLVRTLRAWAWNAVIPLGYLFWRVFLFRNVREATDIGLQLGALISDPITTAVRWSLAFLNSALNVGALAWIGQFTRFFFGMRLRDIASGLLAAAVVLVLLFVADRLIRRGEPANPTGEADSGEALLLGLAGLSFGILPVIMANRSINLEALSHYALPASLAAAVLLGGFIQALASGRLRSIAWYAVILGAALAHYAISVGAWNEERAIEKFWWQVSWRVPALRPGTTLAVHYPSGNIGDDGNGVLEAPNLIYFPAPGPQIPVQYPLSAITLDDSNLKDVLVGKLARQTGYRSHAIDYDYGNVLVLSQPGPSSCVHVIDGRRPLASTLDPGSVILAGPSSRIENVIMDTQPFIPQEFAFGPEPPRDWCYYFEKADLAAQMGRWDEVVALGEQAIGLDLTPQDPSEWIPFLPAYARTGDAKRLRQTGPKINAENFLRLQACSLLTAIDEPLEPEVEEVIASVYCRTAP